MEKKQIKTMALYAALVVLFYWSLENLNVIKNGINYTFTLIGPFIMGLGFAFIANIPMSAMERTFLKKIKKKQVKRSISLVTTILLLLAIVFFMLFLVIPELGKSVAQIGPAINPFLTRMGENLAKITADRPEIMQFIKEQIPDTKTIINTVIQFAKVGLVGTVGSTINVIMHFVNGVVSFVLAFIFSVYILLQKEEMAVRSKRLLQYLIGEKKTDSLVYGLEVSRTIFSNFISGQCLEAVILGCMFFVTMTIFRLPYALLVGVLITVTALVPYIGSFIGFMISLFLIFMISPVKALWFIVIFVVLQQIEGNLIYPKVVGDSVGLPPVWVLLAVLIGTGGFGLIGLLFFIPLFSVFYTLLWDKIDGVNSLEKNKKVEKKEKKIAFNKKAGGHK